MEKAGIPNMKATAVDLKIGDFDFIKDSKRKILEKAFKQDIDSIVAELKKLGYGYDTTVRVTVRKLDGTAGDLLYIQGMVNGGWKNLKQSASVNIWVKK